METSDRQRQDGPLRSILIAVGLTAFGLLAANLTTLPAIALDPLLIESPAEASITARTVFMILNFLGFALAGGSISP